MFSQNLSQDQTRETKAKPMGKKEVFNDLAASGQIKTKSSRNVPSLTGNGLAAFKWIKKGNTVAVLNPLNEQLTSDARVITGLSGKIIEIGAEKFNINNDENNMGIHIPAKIENRSINRQQIPVTSNVVDVVISNHAISISSNPLHLFKESFRILKPGGMMRFFELLNGKVQDATDSNLINESLSSNQYLSPTILNKQLSQAGFHAIRISHSELLPSMDPYFKGNMSDNKEALGVLIVSAQKPANSLCSQPGCC